MLNTPNKKVRYTHKVRRGLTSILAWLENDIVKQGGPNHDLFRMRSKDEQTEIYRALEWLAAKGSKDSAA